MSTYPAHRDVVLRKHIHDMLSEDFWDLRTVYPHYLQHRSPSHYNIDYLWLSNPDLKRQLRLYMYHQLHRWAPLTFKSRMYRIRAFFMHLPHDLHLGTMTREHVEAIYFHLRQQEHPQPVLVMKTVHILLEYIRNASDWQEARPAPDLISVHERQLPPAPPSRPIPIVVIDQLDALLEQMEARMEADLTVPPAEITFWSAVRILRGVGLRFSDLICLTCADEHHPHGCLSKDRDGDWWIAIDVSKTQQSYRQSLKNNEKVVAAIHRQERVSAPLRESLKSRWLFCATRGVYSYQVFSDRLKNLAAELVWQALPYTIQTGDFRDTFLTEQSEHNVDLYHIQKSAGHLDRNTTRRYIAVRDAPFKAAIHTYRSAKQSSLAITHTQGMTRDEAPDHYMLPLAGQLGVCMIARNDTPTCDTCSMIWCHRYRADAHHTNALVQYHNTLHQRIQFLHVQHENAPAYHQYQRTLARVSEIIRTIQEKGVWNGRTPIETNPERAMHS